MDVPVQDEPTRRPGTAGRHGRWRAVAAAAAAVVVATGAVTATQLGSGSSAAPAPAAAIVSNDAAADTGAPPADSARFAIARGQFWVSASSPYSNIRALQFLLNAYGFNVYRTGKYDTATKNAVIKFQRAKRLVTDGAAGPITMKAMVGGANTAARYRWPNRNTTKAVQQLLIKFGYNQVADGDFGPVTRMNTINFQKAKGLPQTGIVDYVTWTYLFNPPPAPAPPASALGSKIAQIARGELANTWRNVERGGFDCNYYSGFWKSGNFSCGGNGNRSEAWCSDFAKYVWYKAGADVAGLSPWAPNFRDVYGKRHGTNHRNNPKVGDAVTYDWRGDGLIDHVEIVIAVSGNTFTAIGGNSGPNNAHIAKRTMSISNSQVVTFVTPVK
ncbi:peptidoglycan-binding protein [Nakamurella aerolata]|uniref:CHAP domain-containing protein n=1 Tax=Nakamurella aerolata TaxID=1656892 RepID=A0A849A562_9ACTN|nr:peptidoglycan-binding protein [Nakamurella aerolata]NNG35699.1 CHAP domain-containing protein [Nakamurella aerolata]